MPAETPSPQPSPWTRERGEESSFIFGNILTPKGLLPNHVLEMAAGRIVRISPAAALQGKGPIARLSGGMLIPGFIDLQVNGVGDCDLARHGPEALHRLAVQLAKEGCTGFLAALITSGVSQLKNGLQAVHSWKRQPSEGARLLGVHLEGPFLNPLRCGVHPRGHLQRPSSQKVSEIMDMAGASLKMMTLAPEIPGAMALVARLRKAGAIASIGHSDATYAQARRAFGKGVRSATHLFNASSPFHHRAPGVAGAVLDSAEVTAQIIPDGIHVHTSCVAMAYRMKGKDGLAIVTDSLAGAIGAKGSAVNHFHFAGKKIQRHHDRFLDAHGTLAGSSLTMVRAWKNLQSFVKAPAADLIQCLTLTPARLLGLGRSTGSLEIGKDADMVWLDDQGDVAATWVKGEPVYVRNHRLHR